VKRNKFYYHDEEHDLTEYVETDEAVVACWVNDFLTLLFPIECKELIPGNIVGFQINGFSYILKKADEQCSEPLTKEQEEYINKIFKDWKSNGHIKEAGISSKQALDSDKGNSID